MSTKIKTSTKPIREPKIMFSSLEEGDWYSFQGTDSVPIKIGCKLNGKGFYPAKLQYYEVSPFIGNGADFEVHPIKHLILKESCR